MMQNIQESAASTCIQRIDPAQIALSRQAPFMMDQLDLSTKSVFTKQEFAEALKKVSRKIKK